MLIVFEGIDGSGTTTQAKLLAQVLGGCYEHEPTKGPIGKMIRKDLLEGKFSQKVLAHLFAADRQQHLELLASQPDTIHVMDRYAMSSLVYQTLGGCLTREEVQRLQEGFRTPDLTILLDIPIPAALGRVDDRGEAKERFEAPHFLETARQSYLELAREGHAIVIDGTQSVDEIHSQVMRILEEWSYDSFAGRWVNEEGPVVPVEAAPSGEVDYLVDTGLSLTAWYLSETRAITLPQLLELVNPNCLGVGTFSLAIDRHVYRSADRWVWA